MKAVLVQKLIIWRSRAGLWWWLPCSHADWPSGHTKAKLVPSSRPRQPAASPEVLVLSPLQPLGCFNINWSRLITRKALNHCYCSCNLTCGHFPHSWCFSLMARMGLLGEWIWFTGLVGCQKIWRLLIPLQAGQWQALPWARGGSGLWDAARGTQKVPQGTRGPFLTHYLVAAGGKWFTYKIFDFSQGIFKTAV